MEMALKVLNENRIGNIDTCIKKIRDRLLEDAVREQSVVSCSGELILYHYTSIEKLFNILQTDSMWASRSRFSNDASEGEALGQEWLDENQYYGDEFILCFCDKSDILSQWRGYCPGGGASLGFHFPAGYSTYTLLHADYEEDKALAGSNIESYKNRPIPVIYCRPGGSRQNARGVDAAEDIVQLLREDEMKELKVELTDIVPYLKNSYFEEERELRMVFDNRDQSLESCIRFRKIQDGSMVPYIVVKWGNLLQMGRALRLTYDQEKIEELFCNNIETGRRKTIIIPCGRDQAAICAELSKKIQGFRKKTYNTAEWGRWQRNPAKIVCDGHLPIVSITVGPSPYQLHTKEVIERFCRSKYWLQNVAVNCSEIPYVAPKL